MAIVFNKFEINLLKYFATINPQIRIEPGNELFTKNLECIVYCNLGPRKFNDELVTTNLPGLLNRISMFMGATEQMPTLDIDHKDLVVNLYDVNDVKKTVTSKFYLSPPELVDQPNKQPKKRDDALVTFEIKKDVLPNMLKNAACIENSVIAVEVKDGEVSLKAYNKDVKTSDEIVVKIAECGKDVKPYVFNIKKANLKIPYCNYEVTIYEAGLIKFAALDSDFKELNIYIAKLI